MNELTNYINFKTKQFISITGFDIKQENAKDALKAKIKPLLKSWVSEAIASGI